MPVERPSGRCCAIATASVPRSARYSQRDAREIGAKGRDAMSDMFERKDAFMSSMEQTPAQLYWGMAMGAIAVSALLFITGRRGWALFVGQWPPTFIALALFYKLLRPSTESAHSGISSATREMEEALR